MTARVEDLADAAVGGPRSSSARAEAASIVAQLKKEARSCLLPRSGGGRSFGPSGLRDRCRNTAFPTDAAPGHTEISIELLEALAEIHDERVLLVPSLYSTALKRGIRVGILLPKDFDVHRAKPYPIVSLIPPRDPSSGIGAAVVDDRLREKIEPVLRKAGLSDAVIVMPDVMYDLVRRPKVTDSELEGWYRAALDEDIFPYVAARFRTQARESASFSLPRLGRSNVPSRHGINGPPCSIDLFESRAAKSGWTSPVASHDRLLEMPEPIVTPRDGGYAVESARDRVRSSRFKDAGLPPSWEILKQLEGHSEATAIVLWLARSGTKDLMSCAIMLPPDFDVERTYEISTLLLPRGSMASVVGRGLYENGELGRDVISVIPHPDSYPDLDEEALKAALKGVATERILPLVHERLQLACSKNTVSEVILDKERGPLLTAGSARSPLDLHFSGPHVSVNGTWTQLPNARLKNPFAPVPSVERTEVIPEALQKQPADRGAFFAPVFHSEALGKDLRVGVYLPPNYDPRSADRFPVLILLPGRSSALHYWLEQGDLITKLDRMMVGDLEKMIVIVPDNIDSYYVNTPVDADPFSPASKGRPQNAQDFVVKELVDWSTTAFLGDKERLGLGGISMGGYGATLAAAMNPGLFRSVSAHSGVLGSHRCPGQHESTDIAQPDGPNPTRLVCSGALDGTDTKFYVDVGAKDAFCRDDTLEFAAALRARGIDPEVHVFGSEQVNRKHDWEHWGPLLEDWIAFHQGVLGGANSTATSVPRPAEVTEECVRKFAADQREKWESKAAVVRGLASEVDRLDRALTILKAERTERTERPEKDPAHHGFGSKLFADALESAERSLREGRSTLELTAGVYFEGDEQRFKACTEEMRAVRAELVELSKELDAWETLGPEVSALLLEVITRVPAVRSALAGLVRARPELFSFSGKDSVTGELFAADLARHVKRTPASAEETEGLVSFLKFLASFEWSCKIEGTNHGAGVATLLASQHPGVVLRLIEAARDGRPFALHAVEGEDAVRESLPTELFMKGLQIVRGQPGRRVYPAYQEALLRTLVTTLKPETLAPDRLAPACDSLAVAYERLTGEELRYSWAFNLKYGDDLYLALTSQQGGALAMGNVEMYVPGSGWGALHFPFFHGYDPESDTLFVQDSSKDTRRVPLSGLEFAVKSDSGPAVFYRPCAAIAPLLTPELQRARSKKG